MKTRDGIDLINPLREPIRGDSVVVVQKVHEVSSGELLRLLEQALGYLNFSLPSHGTVIIKPNLCAPMGAETGATTEPVLIEATIQLIQKINPALRIKIVESASISGDATYKCRKLGIDKLCDLYDVEFVDLSRERTYKLYLRGHHLSYVDVPESLLFADFLISLAKLKTHLWERFSGILKNQFGCLPQRDKRMFHPFLSQVVADVNTIYHPDLCVIDAITGMEGPGPTDGQPRRVNALIVGNDPVAVDTIACRVMGIDPRSVPHLKFASRIRLGRIKGIKLNGIQPETIASPFSTVPYHVYRCFRLALWLQRLARRVQNIGSTLFAFAGLLLMRHRYWHLFRRLPLPHLLDILHKKSLDSRA